MLRRILIIIGVVFLVGLAFLGYQLYQVAQVLEDMGPCGMSIGPCYAQPVNLPNPKPDIEQWIDFPDGKFGLMNLSDTLPPKLIKFDAAEQIVWALEFPADSLCSIPHHTLSEMKLDNSEYGIQLSFFNHSFGEPGRIYLDSNYDVEYMCLSSM